MVLKLWTWATVWRTVLNSGTAVRGTVVRESKKVRVWLKAGSDTGQKDCVTITCWGMRMRRHDFSGYGSSQVLSSSLKGTGRDPRTSEARGWGSPLPHGQPWPGQRPGSADSFQSRAGPRLGRGQASLPAWPGEQARDSHAGPARQGESSSTMDLLPLPACSRSTLRKPLDPGLRDEEDVPSQWGLNERLPLIVSFEGTSQKPSMESELIIATVCRGLRDSGQGLSGGRGWFLHEGVWPGGPGVRFTISTSSFGGKLVTFCDFSQNLLNAAVAAAAKSLQSCPTLCDPIDDSPPGSPVPGTLQARTLEWVAISFSNAWKWKVKVKLLSCVRLSDPMDCSLPGSSVYGIFQARVLTGVRYHCLLR